MKSYPPLIQILQIEEGTGKIPLSEMDLFNLKDFF